MINTAPFGNPDGSRSDIKEVIDDFVSFDDIVFGDGLATKPSDLSVRVIVGAKGSGKTIYLRRLQAAASDNTSLYADAVQQDLPNTSNIVRFCQCFREEFLTEKWMQLWYCAIIRSLVSHLLCTKALASQILEEQKQELANYHRLLMQEFRRPLSVYSQVSHIINTFNTDHLFSRYFDDPDWPVLEDLIAEIIRRVSPVCFFIDSVDEEYENAPMFWLRCQKGLFYRTMRFLRDAKLGGRLHIVVCIRDHAMASILTSEHASRYQDEPHIRTLSWNYEAAEFFLQQKLGRLPESYFMRPNARSLPLVARWLGISKVQNRGRGIDEDVTEYILRHTRLLPRDIVIVGNHLCHEIRAAKERGERELPQSVIRQCINYRATGFGSEQLRICANQIVSSGMPHQAGRKGFSEVYTGDNEYRRGFEDKLKELIRSIGKDRFSRDELKTGTLLAKQEMGETSDPFSVLWQNRLLGYLRHTPEGPREVFFSENTVNNFNLPTDQGEYLFHSCIIDSVGIQPVGSVPVGVNRNR
jgi:hypothetical protein